MKRRQGCPNNSSVLCVFPPFFSERAKGAEKASCGETVVQTGVSGESVFFSAPLRLLLKYVQTLELIENTLLRPFYWEKESIRRPAPVQNFSLPKENEGHRGKISVVDMVFLVFIGILYPPLTWKVFL